LTEARAVPESPALPEPRESALEPDRSGHPSARARIEGIVVLVGIFFAVLMGAMDGLVVSTVLPTVALDLHQVNGVTFVVSGYLVSSTVAIPIFARLSDISSRRNVFLAGIAVFVVGSALAGMSQNLSELIVFRSIQGFGGGGVFPVAIALVAAMFPPATRTRAIAMLSGAAGLAIVAGPLLGSYIVSVTTWRWVFYVNLPFGAFAMIVLLLGVGPLRAPARGRFDLVGAALVSGWVASLMIALVQVSEAGWAWTDVRVLALLGATGVLAVAWVVWELRSPAPLVPLRLLRRPVLGSASGIMLFTGVVFSALITFLSLYVGLVLHDSAGSIRDIIYFFALPLMAGVAVTGAVLNRVSYRTLIVPGLLLSGVGALFLAGLTAATPLWSFSFGVLPTGGIALPLIPVGFGLGIALAGATVAVQNDAPAAQVGAAIGLARFFQSLGGALGISLLTILQAWRFQQLSAGATGPSGILAATVSSYDAVFLLIAVSILLAFACSFWLTGRVPSAPPTVPAAGSAASRSVERPPAEPRTD
jgi:EmrB/QacA subfamily drug resistance transporter